MADPSEVYIIRVTDLWGNEIKLSRTRWKEHILKEHRDMTGRLRKIQTTITHPDFIIKREARQTLIYTSSTLPNFYVNVYTRTTTGDVITAHLSYDLLAGEVIYTRK